MAAAAEKYLMTTPEDGSDYALRITGAFSDGAAYRLDAIDHPDGAYVFSVWARAESAMNVRITALGVTGVHEIGTSWERLVLRIAQASGSSVDIAPGGDQALYLYKAMLENGTAPTGWVSAEEDTTDRLHSDILDVERDGLRVTVPDKDVYWQVNDTEAGWYYTDTNGGTKCFAAIGVDTDTDEGYLAANRLQDPESEFYVRLTNATQAASKTYGTEYGLQMYRNESDVLTKYGEIMISGNGTATNGVTKRLTVRAGANGMTVLEGNGAAMRVGDVAALTYGSGGGSSIVEKFVNVDTHLIPAAFDSDKHSTTYPLLGSYNYPWSRAYLRSAVITTSDRTRKKDIRGLGAEEALQLLSALRPVRFRMREDDDGEHMGLIAQEAQEAARENGFGDCAFVGGPAGNMGIAYEELIGPLIAVIQGQQRRIEKLESQILDLNEKE